ncbi:TPA: hypothetical protein DDZ86_00680 [Candidatus Dependentiae bacterium]|nr:MAG: hypothetical protein UW09_C0004G0015 [candidate division TM6 bacterium GW2011_GWF2_43_87]HBL98139.1 hypothetical protein [Candidatus Dependentiae bacterium]
MTKYLYFVKALWASLIFIILLITIDLCGTSGASIEGVGKGNEAVFKKECRVKVRLLFWAVIFYSAGCESSIPFSPLIDQKGLPKVERGEMVGFATVPVGVSRNSLGAVCPAFKRYPASSKKGGDLRFKNSFGEFTSLVPVEGDESFEANFQLLSKDWSVEDEKNKLLFRPFCFYDVMGVSELDFNGGSRCNSVELAHYPPLSEMGPDGFVELDKKKYKDLLNVFPGRQALFGSRFRLMSCDELRKKLDGKAKKFVPQGVAAIHIDDGYEIAISKGLSTSLMETDVRYLQEKHPGAIFQLGCQFDGFDKGIGIKGNFLEEMQLGAGQWENACLSTMGAAIIRKYVLSSVNFLDELVHVGKIEMVEHEPGVVLRIKKDLDSSDVGKIKVGIHEDVMVTSGYAPPYTKSDKVDARFRLDSFLPRIDFLLKNGIVRLLSDPVYIFNSFIDKEKNSIRVDQVFVGCLSLKWGRDREARGLTEKNSKQILTAAYKGTLLAAALRCVERREKDPQSGGQEVFLTLVGAASSGNKVEWIVDLLENSDVQDIIADFDLVVHLVFYPDVRFPKMVSGDSVQRFNLCSRKVADKVAGRVKNLSGLPKVSDK